MDSNNQNPPAVKALAQKFSLMNMSSSSSLVKQTSFQRSESSQAGVMQPLENPFVEVVDQTMAPSNPFEDKPLNQSSFYSDPNLVMGNPFLDQIEPKMEDIKPKLPPRPASNTVSHLDRPKSIANGPPLPLRKSPSRLQDSLSTSDSLVKSSDSKLQNSPFTDRFLSVLKPKENIISPDASSMNRRIPINLHLANNTIQHKGSIKCACVSRCYVVTASQNIRLWHLPSGENLKTIMLGDAKPCAMSFIPFSKSNKNNLIVWLALEKGDIFQIDLMSETISDKRALHSCSILHILPYGQNLLTLDEQGALKIWTERDAKGNVSLQGKPRGLRVNSKLNIVHIFQNHLWLAGGKSIEIYDLDPDALTVLVKKFDCGANVGNICKLASIKTDVIYSGHEGCIILKSFSYGIDGKVIEWNESTFEKKRIFQCGLYRIASLIPLGKDILWVGSSTGKISIFNLVSHILIKEFQAHSNAPISDLVLDEASWFQENEMYFCSICCELGEIKFWDALLLQDFIGNYMRNKTHDYCTFEDLKIQICSWNIDSRKPSDLEADPEYLDFLQSWIGSLPDPDVIVFGFQELVDLESKAVTAKTLLNLKTSKQETSSDNRQALWLDFLQKILRRVFPRFLFMTVECKQLVGLFQCVFAKETLLPHISNVQVSLTKTGLGGFHGNKGSIATRFTVYDSSFCFINCHLAAHQSHTSARNSDISTILKETNFKSDLADSYFIRGGDGTYVLDHENCFFSGDLNYRIDLIRAKVIDLILQKKYEELWKFDQLLNQMRQNASFGLKGFQEGILNFDPTFKYDRASHEYDTSEKMRVPAWCDRILWNGEAIQMTLYRRFENCMSDHRPIGASFIVKTKVIQKSLYKKTYEDALDAANAHIQSNLKEYQALWGAQ